MRLPIFWRLCLLFCLPLPSAFADTSKCKNLQGESKASVMFTMENDMFAEKLGLSKSDRWYTSGINFTVKKNSAAPFKLDQRLVDMTDAKENSFCVEYGLNFGQLMFTPVDLRNPAPQPDDRFWGAWLYFGTIAQVRPARPNSEEAEFGFKDSVTTVKLDIGVVGPAALGEQSQKLIHRAIDSPMPEGWNNQLKNELGVQLTLLRSDIFAPAQSSRFGWDITSHYGFGLGTVFDYVNAGATIRIGNNLAGAPVGTIENPSLMAFSGTQKRLYAIGRVDVKASLHNTFLDGSLFRDKPHTSHVKSKFGVWQTTYGVVYEARGTFFKHVAVLINRRSPEFNVPAGKGKYLNFASVMLDIGPW